MGAEIILAIVIIIALIIFGAIILSKRSGIPRKQTILESWRRKHPIVVDLEHGIIGREDGTQAIQEIENDESIVHTKIGRNIRRPITAPNWAIERRYPSKKCRMGEGITIIHPYTYESRNITNLDPYINEIKKQQRLNHNLFKTIEFLRQSLTQADTPDFALDQLRNLTQIAEQTKKIQSGLEQKFTTITLDPKTEDKTSTAHKL